MLFSNIVFFSTSIFITHLKYLLLFLRILLQKNHSCPSSLPSFLLSFDLKQIFHAFQYNLHFLGITLHQSDLQDVVQKTNSQMLVNKVQVHNKNKKAKIINSFL